MDDERTVNTGGDIHSILPDAAARLLKAAAATPLDESARDPGFARRRAMDSALAEVRGLWPTFFR